ncbi:exonuclease domain-containing protein [Undibacterium sp. SXout7W]|uniref:3'-5' exonuclease n=1 Tax=Undibacterium sp. SXout7W TaxID=3413049 RepID=UPI003BF1C400
MRYKNRASAPTQLKTKTELRQLRLKPSADQGAVAKYWQGHTHVDLYDPAVAIPMRPYKPASVKQLTALAEGRTLIGTALCGCGNRYYKSSDSNSCDDCFYENTRKEEIEEHQALLLQGTAWLAQSPLFLDTETTGLDHGAEIIEITLLDAGGLVQADYLVRPSAPVPTEAIAVHGITDADLIHAPTWPEIAAQINNLLVGRLIIAHGADFDERMLKQTNARYSIEQPVFEMACTMMALSYRNGKRWPKLREAALLVNANIPTGPQHRSMNDAEDCRQIVLAICKEMQFL